MLAMMSALSMAMVQPAVVDPDNTVVLREPKFQELDTITLSVKCAGNLWEIKIVNHALKDPLVERMSLNGTEFPRAKFAELQEFIKGARRVDIQSPACHRVGGIRFYVLGSLLKPPEGVDDDFDKQFAFTPDPIPDSGPD